MARFLQPSLGWAEAHYIITFSIVDDTVEQIDKFSNDYEPSWSEIDTTITMKNWYFQKYWTMSIWNLKQKLWLKMSNILFRLKQSDFLRYQTTSNRSIFQSS